MGIRVSKCIGYGIQPWKAPDDFSTRLEAAEDLPLKAFFEWSDSNADKVLEVYPQELYRRQLRYTAECFASLPECFHNHRLHECFVWDGEIAPDTLLLVPPTCLKRWKRHDNDLDWAEETQVHEQQNRVLCLSRGLHPWEKACPPFEIAALLVWAGIPEVWGRLEEMLFVYWA